MPRPINTQTVKYRAEIETPTTYTGYLVDGKKSVPMAEGNRDYKAVQVWIAKGNIPEPAYTQQELDNANKNDINKKALKILKETDWYVIRALETNKKIPNDIKAKRENARLSIK